MDLAALSELVLDIFVFSHSWLLGFRQKGMGFLITGFSLDCCTVLEQSVTLVAFSPRLADC